MKIPQRRFSFFKKKKKSEKNCFLFNVRHRADGSSCVEEFGAAPQTVAAVRRLFVPFERLCSPLSKFIPVTLAPRSLSVTGHTGANSSKDQWYLPLHGTTPQLRDFEAPRSCGSTEEGLSYLDRYPTRQLYPPPSPLSPPKLPEFFNICIYSRLSRAWRPHVSVLIDVSLSDSSFLYLWSQAGV